MTEVFWYNEEGRGVRVLKTTAKWRRSGSRRPSDYEMRTKTSSRAPKDPGGRRTFNGLRFTLGPKNVIKKEIMSSVHFLKLTPPFFKGCNTYENTFWWWSFSSLKTWSKENAILESFETLTKGATSHWFLSIWDLIN